VLLGKAEHVGDHANRDVLGVLLGRIDDVAILHGRDQFPAIGAGRGLELLDGLR
jgi:hypothetical protein